LDGGTIAIQQVDGVDVKSQGPETLIDGQSGATTIQPSDRTADPQRVDESQGGAVCSVPGTDESDVPAGGESNLRDGQIDRGDEAQPDGRVPVRSLQYRSCSPGEYPEPGDWNIPPERY